VYLTVGTQVQQVIWYVTVKYSVCQYLTVHYKCFLRATVARGLRWKQTGDPWSWYNVADDMKRLEVELRGILTGECRNKNRGLLVIVCWSMQFFLPVCNTCSRGQLTSPLQLCRRDRPTQTCLQLYHPVLKNEYQALTRSKYIQDISNETGLIIHKNHKIPTTQVACTYWVTYRFLTSVCGE